MEFDIDQMVTDDFPIVEPHLEDCGDEEECCGNCDACELDGCLHDDEEHDGQPDEYTEWQDYMGGDEDPPMDIDSFDCFGEF